MKISKDVDSITLQAIRLWILQMEKEKKRNTGDTMSAKDVAQEISNELTDRGVTIQDAIWDTEK